MGERATPITAGTMKAPGAVDSRAVSAGAARADMKVAKAASTKAAARADTKAAKAVDAIRPYRVANGFQASAQ